MNAGKQLILLSPGFKVFSRLFQMPGAKKKWSLLNPLAKPVLTLKPDRILPFNLTFA